MGRERVDRAVGDGGGTEDRTVSDAADRSSEHVWMVDGLEEGVARVEVDGSRVMTVPIWLLPSGVSEGELLRVTHDRARERSVLTIVRDVEGTASELERSRKQVEEMPRGHDAGGDIVL